MGVCALHLRVPQCKVYIMTSKRSRNNQYEAHVGSLHKVYSIPSDDPSRKLAYTFDWNEGVRLDSLIEIYCIFEMETLYTTWAELHLRMKPLSWLRCGDD